MGEIFRENSVFTARFAARTLGATALLAGGVYLAGGRSSGCHPTPSISGDTAICQSDGVVEVVG